MVAAGTKVQVGGGDLMCFNKLVVSEASMQLALTSRGALTPSRLCSDPSDEALQRPQWKVMRPTLNLDLRPPPLT